MSRQSRVILFAAIGLAGLPVLLGAAALVLVNTTAYQSRLEATMSEALGMQVSTGGRLGFAFSPGLTVTLTDVHIRNRGTEIASAKQARFWIELPPLLKRQVRIDKIALDRARISVERSSDGRFSFEAPEAAEKVLPTVDWPIVSAPDATFLYADKRSGAAVQFEAGECRLEVQRLLLTGGKRSSRMKNLSFTAQLACAKVRRNDFEVSDLKVAVTAKEGFFALDPVALRIFGTEGTGTARADFSGSVPRFQIRYSLPQFPIEEFVKTMSRQKVAVGRMDFSANLEMQGDTAKQLRQTTKGTISLRGKNFMLLGGDLDRQFSRFESSQNFNLADVGAFFFAGPLGLVVTKGFNFATVLQGKGGSSEIRTLVSDWKVEHGVAQAQDVAMATKENRIALHGGLDFVNDRFNDVTVALVDPEGCAIVRQAVRGSFEHPVVEQPSVVKSLAGPVLGLLR
jgi:AsmA protein